MNTRQSHQFNPVLLITLSTAGIIGVLLYFEQVEVIYISSTLGLIILLLIVAFADLENVGREEIEEKKSIEKITK